MKMFLPLLLALLFAQLPVLAGLETEIAVTNRVILKHPRYEPSTQDCQKALAAIQSFLEHANPTNAHAKGQVSNVLAHAKEYRVQFVANVLDRNNWPERFSVAEMLDRSIEPHKGRKVIYCNFFPLHGGDDGWREVRISVEDGGFWHWQIYYDPSTGRCERLSINGFLTWSVRID